MHTTKLVILGRDGILNEFREGHVTAPEEWLPVPGALEAVSRMNHAGWHVVVATNQAGIGRGMIDMASVNAVHAHMNQLLGAQGGRVDAVGRRAQGDPSGGLEEGPRLLGHAVEDLGRHPVVGGPHRIGGDLEIPDEIRADPEEHQGRNQEKFHVLGRGAAGVEGAPGLLEKRLQRIDGLFQDRGLGLCLEVRLKGLFQPFELPRLSLGKHVATVGPHLVRQFDPPLRLISHPAVL